ncbi:MAG: PfkB family carbohydrate kinase [Rhodobacter sp.]|nr:PfkB family carbohydrate kinase [Rhodobacter sp.]
MTARVFVAGSLHLDVILNAPRLPRLDETLMGETVTYAFGGKGGNQALAAAQMGATVSMAGRTGSDAFGRMLHDRLDASGIDRSQVITDPGPSGMSAAIVDANGDYGAVVVSGANRNILPSDVRLPADTGILVLQNEIPAEVNAALIAAATARGVPVLWNAAPARPEAHRALRESYAIAMNGISLVVNRIEAQGLSGQADPVIAARDLHATGYATVIVTLGAEGLICCTAGKTRALPGRRIGVISSHGAGDMFCGALAARIASGQRLEDALDFAQSAAALHVSTPVETRARITSDAVEAFAQRR